MVEHSIRNRKVVGSTPMGGSTLDCIIYIHSEIQSGSQEPLFLLLYKSILLCSLAYRSDVHVPIWSSDVVGLIFIMRPETNRAVRFAGPVFFLNPFKDFEIQDVDNKV